MQIITSTKMSRKIKVNLEVSGQKWETLEPEIHQVSRSPVPRGKKYDYPSSSFEYWQGKNQKRGGNRICEKKTRRKIAGRGLRQTKRHEEVE